MVEHKAAHVGGRAQRFSEHGEVFAQIKEVKYLKSMYKNDLKMLTAIT